MASPSDPKSTSTPPAAPAAATASAASTRRPYSPPRIASREKIEGRANVCDPLVGGKTGPAAGCSVARS